MFSVRCNLKDFKCENDTMDAKLTYAREITRDLRNALDQKKLPQSIKKSAAYLALHHRMFEIVQNTLDEFWEKNINIKEKTITLKIPKRTRKRFIEVIYKNSGKKFSRTLLKEKDEINFKEILPKNAVSIFSAKSGLGLFGDHGFALAQVSRFLEKNKGNLIIGNSKNGAKIKLQSPPTPKGKKSPSFYSFLAYQDDFTIQAAKDAKDDMNAETDEPISEIPRSPSPLDEGVQPEVSSRRGNKMGLKLEI